MPELRRRRALDLNVKAYGRWLLDWLYDQTDIQRVAEIAQAMADGDPFVENMLYGLGLKDTRPFFARLGLPGITGHPVAAYLDAQGWAQTGNGWYDRSDVLMEDGSDPMEQDVESPGLRIMPAGADVVRRNRASLQDNAPADRPLTERLLRWLYSETVSTGRPAGLVNFVPSDYAIRAGAPGFTLREVQDTARYLHEKGLVTDPGRQPARGLGPQLVALTPDGRECHNGCNADVGQYLERGNSRWWMTPGQQDPVVAGHVFLSYVREDAAQVERLQQALLETGIPVWRDTSDLWPGENWQAKIRAAITEEALVFIACFSGNSLSRIKTYQNEELALAVEQLRLRQPEQPWLIPVRFDDCPIPDRDLGGGRRLSSLQWIDLFGDAFDEGAARLVAAIRRILGPAGASQAHAAPRSRSEDKRGDGDGTESGQAERLPLASAQSQDQPAAVRALTGTWRFTSDGFEATPLMNITNTAMPGHLGLHDQSPFVRIGVCVACEPVSPDTGSSGIGSRFVRLLSRDPIAALTSSLTHLGGNVPWIRQAGHGLIRLEATLGDTDQTGKPVASAMLLPPVAGIQLHGRRDGVACLWLHFEPRDPDGTTARPASLVAWHRRLRQAISLAAGFAGFLADDLSLLTHDDPAARVGILLNAARSMSELVDTGLLSTLPGAIPSPQFLGYAIADRAGEPASDIARTMLAQLCEYNLHLDDFEPALAAL